MASKNTSDDQATYQDTGRAGDVESTSNLQADHNSVAIGGISIDGELSGEVNIAAGNIIKNVQTIHQRALTAAEEAARARHLESKLLAQGIAALVQNLSIQVSEGTQNSNPYKGLLPYSLNEAEIFYGRNKARRDMLTHIKQSPLTVLHAESGAGKSSLLQAGIAAQLIANGHLAVYLRPYKVDPVEFIKRMFLPALSQASGLTEGSLRDFLRQVCAVLGPKSNLYLLLDQFEEFFQLKKEERQPFLKSLADCLNDPSLRVHWVLALRKEALSDLSELESYGITQFKNTYRLNRLSRLEAREAMIEPAQHHGITFEPALIEHILDTLTTNDEVRPTHLQLVCSALTDELPAEKTLTLDYYSEKEGGTEGILRDYLKRQLEDLPRSEQTLAWKVLRALITADRHRAVKTYAELMREIKSSDVSKRQIETILNRLVERRLLFTQTQPAAEEMFELAHDYLIKEIELNPQEQALKAAQELLEQETRIYQRHKTLLTAERLAVIEPYQNELHLSAEAAVLLRESQRAVQEQQKEQERRRKAIVIGISFVSLIVAAILAGWALTSSQQNKQLSMRGTQLAEQVSAVQTQKANANQQARVSRSGELAAQAILTRNTEPILSDLLGVEAYRLSDNVRTRSVLMDNLNAKPGLVQYVPLQDQSVMSIAFSPDGKILAAGNDDSTIVFWDVVKRQPIGQPLRRHTGSVTKVVFSPNGKILASGSTDGTIRLWDVATHQPIGQPLAHHTDFVWAVAFSPDGKILASGGWDRTIILWDVETQKPITELPNALGNGQIGSLAFSPNGKILVSGGTGGITFWNMDTQQPIGQQLGDRTGISSLVAFSPDGKIIASGGGALNRTITLWDVDTQQPLDPPLTGYRMDSAIFSPDGKFLAAVAEDHTIILWDAATRQRIGPVLRGHADNFAIAFSPDGKTLVSGGLDHTMIWWDISNLTETGVETGLPMTQTLKAHTGEVTNVMLTANGKLVASVGKDGNLEQSVILWNKDTQQPIGQPLYFPSDHWVRVSPDGKKVAFGNQDGTINLFDTKTHQSIGTIKPGFEGNRRISSMVFNPDGTILALGDNERTITLWNVATGQIIDKWSIDNVSEPLVSGLVFSPDGKILAWKNHDDITLWEIKTRRIVAQLPSEETGSTWFSGLAFSPDAKTIAVSGNTANSGVITLWDIQARRPLGPPLRTHTRTVTTLAFHPNGKILASTNSVEGSNSTFIIFWDLQKRQPIGQPLAQANSYLKDLRFSPEGKSLISTGCARWDYACRAGEIVFWDVDPLSWIEKTCQRVGRNLTRAEWAQYFPDENYRATCPEWPWEPEFVAPTSTAVMTQQPLPTLDFIFTLTPWPTLPPSPIPSPAPTVSGEPAEQININTASASELGLLPGVGPSLAEKIIDYRSQNGPFLSIEDIINVPGAGPGLYERIKDLITVGD